MKTNGIPYHFLCELKELLAICEKANFKESEWKQYEDSVVAYADLKNYTDFAYEKGMKNGLVQGIEQGKQEVSKQIARQLLKEGLSKEKVAEISGLSVEVVEGL